MTDDIDPEKFKTAMSMLGWKPEDLEEQPDDIPNELVDEYAQYVRVLSERGFSAVSTLAAAQLMFVKRLDDIEMAIMSFSDNLMLHLESADSTKGPAMTKWTTEELLKHYNPEILEFIKDGDAELEVFEDRVVLRKPIKPK